MGIIHEFEDGRRQNNTITYHIYSYSIDDKYQMFDCVIENILAEKLHMLCYNKSFRYWYK